MGNRILAACAVGGLLFCGALFAAPKGGGGPGGGWGQGLPDFSKTEPPSPLDSCVVKDTVKISNKKTKEKTQTVSFAAMKKAEVEAHIQKVKEEDKAHTPDEETRKTTVAVVKEGLNAEQAQKLAAELNREQEEKDSKKNGKTTSGGEKGGADDFLKALQGAGATRREGKGGGDTTDDK